MNKTPTLAPPPLHSSLGLLKVSATKNTVMGFKLGTTFASQRAAFEGLAQQGFDLPPVWTERPVNRFLLERAPAHNIDLEVALSFEYKDEQLKNIAVIVTREMEAGESPANVIHDIEAALVESLGKPHLLLDKIDGMTRQQTNTTHPVSAYALFWSASQVVPPKATLATDNKSFYDALTALGHGGALATVTGIAGSVMASVDFFEGTCSDNCAGQFLSFVRQR